MPEAVTALRPSAALGWAVALAGLLATCWALVSPLGSVPDEPAHVIYAAAVVRGQIGDGPTGRVVHVPADVASSPAQTCAAFRPEVTADCAPALDSSTREVAIVAGAARYPPLYYALVGWPTLLGFNSAVWYFMRIISVLLGVLLLWLAACAWPDDRPEPSAGLLLAATPMTAFLLGSVNPSGVEIVSGMAFMLAGCGVVEQLRRGGRLSLAGLVGLVATGAYLALARPSTYLLLIALGGVLLVHAGSASWRVLRTSRVGVGAASLLAVFLVAVLYARASAAPPGPPTASPITFSDAVNQTWEMAPHLFLQTVGIFGWLDHQPSPALRVAWIGMTIALVVAALVVGAAWSRAALLALSLGALLVAPLFVLLTLFRDGLGYQARYAMALTQAIPLLAAAVLGQRTLLTTRSRTLLAWVPVATMALGLLALAGSYLRYAVGLPLDLSHVLGELTWLPPTWPLVLVALATAVWVVWRLRRQMLGTAIEPVPLESMVAT